MPYAPEIKGSDKAKQPVADKPQPKKIGRLTFEERQRKIDRYRTKRNTRVWTKKISYTCRKRVADQRLRIKGRFVSKTDAKLLTVSPPKSREGTRVAEPAEKRTGDGMPTAKVGQKVSVPSAAESAKKAAPKQIFSIIKKDCVEPLHN